MREYTADVTYTIVCGRRFTVQAASRREAVEKIERLAADEDMLRHVSDSGITHMDFVRDGTGRRGANGGSKEGRRARP